MPEVTAGRFWSKQYGWGSAAQSPLPPPYIFSGVVFRAIRRERCNAARQRFFEPLPQYTRL